MARKQLKTTAQVEAEKAVEVKATPTKVEVKEVKVMKYRELQAALKQLKAEGAKLIVKLNATTAALQAEYERLTATKVEAPTKEPKKADVHGITYRELQAALKGKTTVKLNSKYDILLAEYKAINK